MVIMNHNTFPTLSAFKQEEAVPTGTLTHYFPVCYMGSSAAQRVNGNRDETVAFSENKVFPWPFGNGSVKFDQKT